MSEKNDLKPIRDETRLDRLFLELVSRLFVPLLMVFLTMILGTLGYYIIGMKLGENWTMLDCILMTSITLTTVGYGDVFNAMHSRLYEIYTILLMWSGMGVTLYSISAITAFIVEKHLARFFKERTMQKRIKALKDHYIICGGGNTGVHVVGELHKTKRSFVVIDHSEERLQNLEALYPDLIYFQGDATKEETLVAAGIGRAIGLITVLSSDSLNMLLTVTARFLHKDIRIISRCTEHSLAPKLKLAGADAVISPNFIGGMRMASEMIRPSVVGFLDKMLRGNDKSIRFEEVKIKDNSPLCEKTLSASEIHEKTGLNIIAIERSGQNEYLYNPGGDTKIDSGDTLVTIGNAEQMASLLKLVEA